MIDLAVLESGSFVQQILTLDEIEKSADPSFVPALAALLDRDDLDESLRQAATDTLQSVMARNPELVLRALGEPSSPALKVAVQLVGRLRLEAARAPLAEFARNTSDGELLVDLLSSLGEIADDTVVGVFRDAARSGDPFVSALAIRHLGALGDTGSLPFLGGLLCEADEEGKYETCSVSAAASVEALGRMVSDEALTALIGKIHHRNPTIRRLIHEVLVGKGEAVVGELAPFLDHGDVDEKIMAVALLGQIRSAKAIEPILAAMDRGSLNDPNARFAVYDALGNVSSLKTMIRLVDGLSEGDEMTLVAVLSSLNRIVNPGVVMKVKDALADRSSQAGQVARALVGACALDLFKAVWPDGPCAEVLAGALTATKDAETREAFAGALRELGGESGEALARRLLAPPGEGRKKRILAVDDSRSILMFYRAALSEMGYEVVTALNGVAALDALANDPCFDLIITDMNMPQMNGVELTRNVRDNVLLSHIPVIMATTESDHSQIDLANKAGVTGYVVKPIKPRALEETLHSALG